MIRYDPSRTVVVDFETRGIQPAPLYPPEPIGVALSWPNGRREYLAWGHKTKNNCTKIRAASALKSIYKMHDICFHNGSFDLAVGCKHLGLPWLDIYHDTLFLLFLNNPREVTFSLKPMMEKWLKRKPEERDRMKEWILTNVKGSHENSGGAHPEMFYMNFLAECPGDIVGDYAMMDVEGTEGLLRLLSVLLEDEGLNQAYEREIRCSKVIYKMEQRGVLIDEPSLRADLLGVQKAVPKLQAKIFKKLGTKEFNLGSSMQLVEALEKAKIVDPGDWVLTPKGNISTSRENLMLVLKKAEDKELLDLLELTNIFQHVLNNFMEPWAEILNYSGNSRIYPRFHQVRGRDEGRGGTKTGRLSSTSPNFQNLNRNPEESQVRRFAKLIASLKIPGLHLPMMRKYIIPGKKRVLLKRDYSQQEPRILAHFEQGRFLQLYQQDPKTDAYNATRAEIKKDTGIDVSRYNMKVLFLSLMYGLSIAECAERMECSVQEAQQMKSAFLRVLPGVRELQQEIKLLVRDNLPIRTWGGRLYYCEKPKVIKGRLRTFEYRLLNILIQGSSAECTKEAMIRVDESCTDSELTLQVHDELVMATPSAKAKTEMARMREAMESIEFDLVIRSDGSWSKTNYAEMEDCLW